MEYLLGIDLGTSSVKTILLETGGKMAATAQANYETKAPKPGYAEQDPREWWAAVVATIREILQKKQLAPRSILAVGFSGQMHGTVLLDESGRLAYPAVIWCDQRSIRQVEQVQALVGKKRLSEITCNALSPGFMFSTLVWLRQEASEVYDRARHVLLPKDYIRYLLTGAIGCETTDASSTCVFDTVRECWSGELIRAAGLNPSLFPPVAHAWDLSGRVTKRAAEETGLAEGTPVVYGGGDQAMQALGSGTIQKGIVSSTIGSGGQVFAATDSPVYDIKNRTNTFCNVAPGSWYLLGASLNAGLALNWFQDKVLCINGYGDVEKAAAALEPGCDGLIFLPYLTGDRTPHQDPKARGLFFGLTMRHTQAHFLKAVMEGVTFSMRDSIELFREMGVGMERVVASGGGARSAAWLQMQADIYNTDIYTTENPEQAGVGAAIVAGIGAGVYPDIPTACGKAVAISPTPTRPIEKNVAAYDRWFALYRELYQTNKELFRKL